MPIARIQLPDGRIAKFEVPEGTTPDQVMAFASQNMGGPEPHQMSPGERPAFDADFNQQLNDSMGPLDKFLVGAGRGMNTIGRGLGLVGPESEIVTRAADQLADDSTAAFAGEIVGEVAPFLPAGVVAGAAKSLATRVGLNGILGILEGGSIVRGKGGDTLETLRGAGVGGAVAGAAEILLPVLGRLGNSVFGRLKRTPKGPLLTRSGEPTQELLSALDEAGMTFDDLAGDAVEFIAQNQKALENPTEALRKARFDEFGIPATKGDISQDFRQQARESRLSSMAVEEGEPLRQMRLQQSQAWEGKVRELVSELGVPEEVGDSVKDALMGRKKLLQKVKNDLYEELAQANPEITKIPILGNDISKAIPEGKTLRRLERLAGSQVGALRELLVEFGIDKSDEAVEAFVKSGDEITPLTMGNLEDFRQALNQIDRADSTGAASVAVGPIRNALDKEAEAIDSVFEKYAAGGVLDTAKRARKTVRKLKTEFSPESITGRLIDVKRDGVTPVVEASRVFREMVNKPTEQLERTMQSLVASGSKGRKAVGDMRAAVILQALEDSLKAPSRKTAGIETFSGYQFFNSLRKFGDDKLDVLFRGDEKAKATLKKLAQVGLDAEPTNAAVPKGSGPVNMDIAWSLAKNSRVVSAVQTLWNASVNAGSENRAVSKALLAKPEMKRVVGLLEAEFPAVAAAVGVSAMASDKEKGEE